VLLAIRTSFGLLDEGEGVAEVGRERVFGGEGCGDRRGSVKCCGSRQLSKPRVKSGEILVREPAGRVDGAEQRGCGVMHGHPVPVGVSDLVVYPGKRAPGCPVHEGSGLPAESEPLVLALTGSGRLRPGHYRQIRQSEPGRYLGIGILQPGRGPHQGAGEPGKPGPGVQAKPR